MTMRIYTAWGRSSDDAEVVAFAAGEEPPRSANGQVDPDRVVALWRVEAATWEEAMAIRNLRCGYEPYRPQGAAAPCPQCGALHYPRGSGQCWNCGHEG